MVRYASLTNQGGRELNEDSIGAGESGGRMCFAVADGLGGHDRGEVASRAAVDSVLADFSRRGSGGADDLAEYFEAAQRKLLEMQGERAGFGEMLTTLNVLCVSEEGITGGHVGDTRTYYFHKGKMISRTIDHSVPQMLASAGEIKESQIRGHVDRNRLLRAMGTKWTGPAYAISETVMPDEGQAFLLCTDGFWELILEKQMMSALKKSDSPEEWLRLMEKIIQKKGRNQNMDNYSAIAVWVDG